MLPKNSKHCIIPTAEKLNKDAQLVEDIVSFYYSTVRKALTNFLHYNIRLEGIGTFKIKQKELPKLQAKYTKHLSVTTRDTFTQMQLRKELTTKLYRITRITRLIEKEKQRKRDFKTKKYARLKEDIRQ